MPPRICCPAITLGLLLSSQASAVMLHSTSQRNTDPPGSLLNRETGLGPEGSEDQRRLLNSGWQYQGDFRGFLGTPISSKFFITAKHIGGEFDATNVFVHDGTTYTINTAGNFFDSPHSDLRIWRINETFPTWAPLNTSPDEQGKSVVMFGRGTQRGEEVRVNGVLKGWKWGVDDRVRSWGENRVSAILDGGSGVGDLLGFAFEADAGRNEGALTLGDSSGGIFVESDGIWKLAGIGSVVDGPWAYTNGGETFDASLFDFGGMYHFRLNEMNEPVYTFLQDQFNDRPASSYAVRLADPENVAWIQSVLSLSASPATIPEPASLGAVAVGSFLLLRRRPPGRK
jgi:hypothetical protein